MIPKTYTIQKSYRMISNDQMIRKNVRNDTKLAEMIPTDKMIPNLKKYTKGKEGYQKAKEWYQK